MVRSIIILGCLYMLWPSVQFFHWLATASEWERIKEFSSIYITNGYLYKEFIAFAVIYSVFFLGIAAICFAGWKVNGRTLLDEMNETPVPAPETTAPKPLSPKTQELLARFEAYKRQKQEFDRRQG